MSMEHKAFLFDSMKFDLEIKNVMERCWCNDTSDYAIEYIEENYKKLKSPYTGENLNVDWRRELNEDSDIQEYLEFILTACYDPSEDIGLQYSWDVLIDVLKQLNKDKNVNHWILGNEMAISGNKFDPGKMGFGILNSSEVKDILQFITESKIKLHSIDLNKAYLYKMTYEETKDAYNDLCDIYRLAVEKKMGFIMTF